MSFFVIKISVEMAKNNNSFVAVEKNDLNIKHQLKNGCISKKDQQT